MKSAGRTRDEAPPPIDTVGRTLAILDGVGLRDTPATLADVVRRTRLPKSTVYRFLTMLEKRGAVRRAGGGYLIGGRIYALTADDSDHAAYGHRLLTPHIADLYEALHQSVSLAVLTNFEVHYLQTIYPRSHTQTIARTNRRAPVYCTAAGKVLLAHDPVAITQYAKGTAMTAFTPRTITTWHRLESELTQIRRDGIAVCLEEYVTGFVSLAVPVLDTDGRPLTAISVAGPKNLFDFKAVEKSLRVVALAATRTLRSAGNSWAGGDSMLPEARDGMPPALSRTSGLRRR